MPIVALTRVASHCETFQLSQPQLGSQRSYSRNIIIAPVSRRILQCLDCEEPQGHLHSVKRERCAYTHIHYISYELEEPGYETTKHTVVAKHVKQIIHRTAYCHCLAASGGYAYNHPPLEDRSRVHHPSVRDQSHCVCNPSVAYEEFPSGKIPLTTKPYILFYLNLHGPSKK